MQKIKKLFEINKKNFLEILRNFPIPLFSSVFILWILEYLVFFWWDLSYYVENILWKIVLSLWIIFILWIWIKFFLEDKMWVCWIKEKKKCVVKKKIIGFMPIIFWILFYFNFEENLFNNFYFEELLYIFISFIWAFWFVFISKFIKIKRIEKDKKSWEIKMINWEYNEENYFLFTKKIISKIFQAWIFWLILMILWNIWIFSIFSLFNLWEIFDKWKVYWLWMIFSWIFFSLIYFLNLILENKIKKIEDFSESKINNFLVLKLFLPAVIIYFFILYIYDLKIILDFWNWPNWKITWMTIWFSLLGYLVYLYSFAFEKISNLARIFRKYFPIAVLFQLPMFFYAIYLRINQYDFTINRYLLLAFWIYLLVISLYFIFSEKKKLMSIFWILFLFISIISISWNYSVYKFPENRQLESLEKSLIESWILKEVNWEFEVFLPEKDLPKKFATEIYHKVDYLCEFHWCDILKKVLPKLISEIKNADEKKWVENNEKEKNRFKKAIEEHWDDFSRTEINKRNLKKLENEKYTWIDNWDFRRIVVEKLKVENYYYKSSENANFISVRLDNLINTEVYDVKWWDFLLRIYSENDLKYHLRNIRENGGDYTNYEKLYYAKYNFEKFEFSVFKWDKELEKINFSDIFDKFYEKNKDKIQDWWYIKIKKPFGIEYFGDNLDVKIILNQFNIKNIGNGIDTNEKIDFNSDGNYMAKYLTWKVLIREK